MNVAVLGMGRMGRALAGRLLEGGHAVAVWNRSSGRAADVVSAGAREAPGVADAVAGTEVAITMLANDDAVRAIALGELRSSLGSRASYVDCSTVSPILGDELAEAFPGQFLALPVLGSPAALRAGQAVLVAGGDSALVDRLGPVLSSLSDTIRRYETPRLALTAKLTNNLLLLWQVVAVAEALAVGRSGGLTDDQLRELLSGSAMVAPGVRNRFESILTGSRQGWWTTVLGAKDAELAIDLARAAGVELTGTEQLKRLYDKAAAMGLDDSDIAAVTELYR